MKRRGQYIHHRKGDGFIRMCLLLLFVVLLGGIFGLSAVLNKQEEQEAHSNAEMVDTSTIDVASEATEPKEIALQEPTEPLQNHVVDEYTEMTTTSSEADDINLSAVEETTEPKNVVVEVSKETENIYSEVLDQYRAVIKMDSADFHDLFNNETEYDLRMESAVDSGDTESVIQILELPTLHDRYPLIDGSTVEFFHYGNADADDEYSDPSVYNYAYYNIDGSRDDELLIGVYDDYRDEYVILAIYTISYDEPHLLQSVRDDRRWHLTIYTDGTYCVDGSGGASLHHWSYYRLHEMFGLDEMIADFTIDYSAPRADYLASVISEYEKMLTPVEDVVWNPLMKG